MPKLKSKRGAAKRFRVTAKGKVKMKKSNLRHILTTKSSNRKRGLRKAGYVAKPDAARIRRMITG